MLNGVPSLADLASLQAADLACCTRQYRSRSDLNLAILGAGRVANSERGFRELTSRNNCSEIDLLCACGRVEDVPAPCLALQIFTPESSAVCAGCEASMLAATQDCL